MLDRMEIEGEYDITTTFRFKRKYGIVWVFFRKEAGWNYAIVFHSPTTMPLVDHGYGNPMEALQYVNEWEERTGRNA